MQSTQNDFQMCVCKAGQTTRGDGHGGEKEQTSPQ